MFNINFFFGGGGGGKGLYVKVREQTNLIKSGGKETI